MKTQAISQNTHLFLQSHPHEANTCRESFEILQDYLQRTVNLLGKRLFQLTKDQADLSEIGKAQRALSGALANFHKTLATLGDIQDIEHQVPHDALARDPQQEPDPQRFVVNHPEPPAEPDSRTQPTIHPNPQPAPPPDHTPESQTQANPAPDPPKPQNSAPEPLDPDDDLPPLDPFSDDFEKVADLYEARLNAAFQELQNPQASPPENPGPTQDAPAPKNIAPPKKYNTRRKRKDPKYLRKLQKRHAKKTAAT